MHTNDATSEKKEEKEAVSARLPTTHAYQAISRPQRPLLLHDNYKYIGSHRNCYWIHNRLRVIVAVARRQQRRRRRKDNVHKCGKSTLVIIGSAVEHNNVSSKQSSSA